MRPSRTVVWLLAASLLALALASERSVGPGPARADDLVVSQQVRNQVANNGQARVIVELRLPGTYVPEGELPTPAHVAVQRANLTSAQQQMLSRLQGRGHTVVRQFQTAPFLVLVVEPDALQELEASSFYVRRVIEDTLHQPMLAQSVPIVQGNQAWASGYDGTGTVIAIVDTGVDKTHPFLAGKVVEEACFSSAVPGQTSSFCPNGQSTQFGSGAGVNCPSNVPFCWHGTHVAGIAAGNGAGAGVSYSGVAKGARIMAVQVFSRGDSITTCGPFPPCLAAWLSDILAGLERVYTVSNQYSFAAVNLSVGRGSAGICDLDPAKPFIDNLRSVGIATVIAAGNSGAVSQVSAPACVSSAVSVGSTEKDDSVSSFSNVSETLSLFAPGGGILSSCLPAACPGGWKVDSGTSMAAPHVSGAWAILKQKVPGASVATILTALQQTGVPVTDERLFGVPRPRIRIADALSTLGPPAPPPPPVTHTLAVASENPNSGVGITVSPVDTGGLGNGTTPFSRVYQQNTVVTLTAPVTSPATTFQKWRRDGTDFSTSPSVQVTMDADHTLTAVYVLAPASNVLRDFNGDGQADIVWRHAAGAVAVWLMNGGAIGSVELPGGVATDWTIAGVGDVNGDGQADIVWRHTGGAVAVWLMNGGAIGSVGVPGGAAPSWTIAGVGDVNGDGTADLVWRHSTGGVAVWLMNGGAVGSVGLPGGVATDWAIAGMGDVNGDGKADIVWRHAAGAVAVWLMNGGAVGSVASVGGASPNWAIQ